MRNITEDLSLHALARPESPAIIMADCTLSYAELDDAVWRTVRWLQDAGIRPGAIVGLIMVDQISLLVAMLGLMRLGATAFPLAPSTTGPQKKEWLRQARASAVLSDATTSTPECVQLVPFGEVFVSIVPLDHEPPPRGSSAPCLLISSSGSTGHPKLIPLSHDRMLARFAISLQIFNLRASDRLMVVSPLHFAVASYFTLAALSVGATGVIWNQRGSLASAVVAAMPDMLHLSVFHAERILQECQANQALDLSAIRVVSVGASTVSEALRRRMSSELKAQLHVHYGTNEAGTVGFATPEDLIKAPGSVGRPPPGVIVEIVDDQGTPVGPGQVGQVRVKSPAQIAGYLHADDGERFRDGWFYPGDLAMWSEDGQIFHCGRADQMMIMNGINIFPAEIERVVEQHPGVRDVVAFPLKHAVAQEVPACAVVLQPDAQTSQAELEAFALQRLGARTPRVITILDTIPRNEQGKPQRAELLRLVEAALAKRISPLAAPEVTPSINGRGAKTADVPPRQPARQIRLNFSPPRALETSTIDAWFSILSPELGAAASLSGTAAAKTQEARVADWLGRTLLLARELLQLGAIPVFDAPKVLACKPQPEGESRVWRAVIAMPAIDHVPGQIYEIAIGTALRIAAWMARQAPNEAAREELFAKLEQEAIQPIKQRASAGKSTIPLLRAAYARGIPFRSLGGGIYQLGLGAKGRLTDRSTSERDTAIGLKLAQSKPLTAQALRIAGLPAPIHQVATSIANGRAAADRLGWPVVVKPADLDRGEGVSVDVDAASLEQAFEAAQRLSKTKQVIVERQVPGICHRLFLASGRLLYAVKRLPMGVYGDGIRSVEALVADALAEQAKLPPWRRSELRPIDDLARTAIAAAGFQQTSVPDAGLFIPLRRIESTAWGGIDEEVTDHVHPDNLRAALAAAELFRLDVAGIDMISPDISEPWHRNGAIINEVNFAPLLGGGEISRRYIGEYIVRLLDGDGRIPIEAFVGGEEAWLAALARSKALGGDDAGVFVTSAGRTVGGKGQEIRMPLQGLHGRTSALLLSRQVRALLLVVQDDEWLLTGLPVEYLDRVIDTGGGLKHHQRPDVPLPMEQERTLRQLLSGRVPSTAA